jgi:hypothetical protein
MPGRPSSLHYALPGPVGSGVGHGAMSLVLRLVANCIHG